MTTRYHYAERLDEIKLEVLKMGSQVEEAIQKAVHAFMHKDGNVAEEVIKGDEQINMLEASIEAKCVVIIATEQPVASDLRFIISTLKIIRDIERIGDYAVHIATAARNLSGYNPLKINKNMSQMAYTATGMFKDSMKSYSNVDSELAYTIYQKDNVVDSLYANIIKDLVKEMKNDPEHLAQVTTELFMAKYIERLADHVTNICEEIDYIHHGKRRDWGR